MLPLIQKKKYEREKEEKIINIDKQFSDILIPIICFYDIFKPEPFFLINKKEYLDFCVLSNIYYLGDLLIQDLEKNNLTIEGHMNHILRFTPQNSTKENIMFYLTAKLFIYLKYNQHTNFLLIQNILQLKKYIDNGPQINILEISEFIQINNLLTSVSIE